MALDQLIPRIEWNEITLTGNTHSNNMIDGLLSTANVKLGMVITGPGIPNNTTVIGKTTDAILISNNASASASGVTLTLFQRFDFTYPPSKDTEEKPSAKVQETRSISGQSQVLFNYIEYQRDVTYDFVSKSDRDTLQKEFFKSWAAFGNSFRYFHDKADSEFVEYMLRDFSPDFERQIKKHPYFLYQIKFSFKRVE